MRFFRPLIVLTILLTTSATEVAAYQMIGPGVASCGSWTANRRDSNPGALVTLASQAALGDESWILGFLSGVGFVGENGVDPLDDMDAYGVWAWIDNYCRANPIKNLADAAAAFYFVHPHR